MSFVNRNSAALDQGGIEMSDIQPLQPTTDEPQHVAQPGYGGDTEPIVAQYCDSESEDEQPAKIRSIQSRPSEGHIDLTPQPTPVALFASDKGEVCADSDKPDLICSPSTLTRFSNEPQNSVHRTDEDDNAVRFAEGEDPRIWTDTMERGEDKILQMLPSRARHSTKRRKKPLGEPTPDEPPGDDNDIEAQLSKRALSRRSGSGRSSVRSTIKKRVGQSIKRKPMAAETGATFSLATRRTIRRGELAAMDQVEVKQLPVCTRIGYEFTLAVQRGARKIQEGLRNMKIWGQPIKQVEGNFGSGVATYFRVLRWLLKINLLNMLIGVLIITVPGSILGNSDSYGHAHRNHTYNANNTNCTNPNIIDNANTTAENAANWMFQFITGSGWMESTPLYIGWYPTQNITKGGDKDVCHSQCDAQYCVEIDPESREACWKVDSVITVINGSISTAHNCQILPDEYACRYDNKSSSSTDEDKTTVDEDNVRVTYNFPLAYIIAGLSYYAVSLIFIARNIQRLFKKSAVESMDECAYTNLVLCGWDYTIISGETAKLKSRSILKELKEELHMDESKENEFSPKKKILLGFLRLLTNLLCLASMGAVFYLFYQEFEGAQSSTNSACETSSDFSFNATDYKKELANIWDSYGTSIIVSVSNIVFPIFFEVVGNLEMYQFQATRINVTMLRSYVMKLFSVIVYLIILFKKVEPITDKDGKSEEAYFCWEDIIAMEMYKLVIMDFCIFLVALFCSEVLRAFLVRHIKFLRGKLDVSEFNIPKEVLDICYKQMIIWAGLFWAPLLSVVAVLEIILIFYIKKCSALHNVRPPDKVVLNSKNSSVINLVYLISLLAVFGFSGFYVFNRVPSNNCGPFQDFSSFVDPLNNALATTGDFKKHILDNLRTTSILLIFAIVMFLIIYYFHSLASSRQLTVQLLRKQIRIENADKKFLIEHIKKGQSGKAASGQEDEGLDDEAKQDKKSKKKAIGSYANPQMKLR